MLSASIVKGFDSDLYESPSDPDLCPEHLASFLKSASSAESEKVIAEGSKLKSATLL